MTTIREYVTDALREFPETRNDDRELYIRVLMAMGLAHHVDIADGLDDGLLIRTADFGRLPGFESIIRRRAEIQNEEKRLIPTDPEVLRARGFYRECPRERLLEEDQPTEMIEAVCRKCPKVRTDACHVFGAALAVSRA